MTFFSAKNDDARTAIVEWLDAEYPEYRTATAEELERHGLAGRFGWHLPVTDSDALIVSVDAAFPYSLPTMAIDGAVPLEGPHVERRQRLCTFGSNAEIDPEKPVEVVQAYINHALELLASNDAGENDDDYQSDFEAYWQRETSSDDKIRFLLNVAAPSRLVAAEYGRRSAFLAESREEVKAWVAAHPGFNAHGEKGKAAFVWLNELPKPDHYPNNLAELYRLLEAQAPDAIAILDELFAPKGQKRFCILLAGPSTDTRASTGAVTLQRRTRFKRPIHIPITDVPTHLRGSAFLFARSRADAVDGLRTRLPAKTFETLRSKHAVLIGCGSLGAGLARILGQTGVGRLTLIDPELLSWENLGRHELGVSSVGKEKAGEVAAMLRGQMPYLIKVDSIAKDWVEAAAQDDNLFAAADLVIATTGSWVAEAALNDFQRAGHVPCPIVYGWMERRACAAHALLIGNSGACLRCGFDSTGLPIEPATRWDGAEHNEQCAAPASPYGAAELSIAQSLVASLAIDTMLGIAQPVAHRIWLAPRQQLEREGGGWSKFATAWMGEGKQGGCMTAAAWPEHRGCSCH